MDEYEKNFNCSFETKRRLKVSMKRDNFAENVIEAERRIIFEQRQFSYDGFIPERRSGKGRRHAGAWVCTRQASPARSTDEK